MSDVTPQQILDVVRDVMGTDPAGRLWKGNSGRRASDPRVIAREAAVWLIRQHTAATWREIAPLLALADVNDALHAAPARFVVRLAEGNKTLLRQVERMQQRIDAIHDLAAEKAARKARDAQRKASSLKEPAQ